MNSALKPVIQPAPSGAQNAPVAPQLNKPMHPQPQPPTYGQPPGHLVNMSANAHPNPAHQQNHYSLNVNTSAQYNSSAIPASNHPIATGQHVSPQYANMNNPKTVVYSGSYQPNLGHPPNHPLPPVSQTLPASQLQSMAASSLEEKPQSNGTSPKKLQENHILSSQKEKFMKDSEVEKSLSDNNQTQIEQKNTSITEVMPVIEEKSKLPLSNADIVKSTMSTRMETVTLSPSTPASLVKTSSSVTQPLLETAVNSTSESGLHLDKEKEYDMEIEEDDEQNASSRTSEDASDEMTPQTEAENLKKESPQQQQQYLKSSFSPPKVTLSPRTPMRKPRVSKADGDSPKSTKSDLKQTLSKSPNTLTKSKRTRIRTQPYQSPLPEIEILTKISTSAPKTKGHDEKLIVFYKNEFLAVRNSEGSFYICQASQNIYKSSPKIRIRWLSQDKNEKSGEIYTPDFYDNTDFDCILTNLNLERVDKGRYRLPPSEKERTDSILKRSLAVEKGEVTSPSLTEEHPDGIDVSLYKEESQLKKKKRRGTKRKGTSTLRSSSMSKTKNDAIKMPDQSKVRKITKKSRRNMRKQQKQGDSQVQQTGKATSASMSVATTSSVSSSTLSRTERAKRRNDNQNHSKVKPIVDQKKAKVLAKVARKTAISTSKTNTASKNTPTKAAKLAASSLKVQKASKERKASTKKAATTSTSGRKTKRSRK